MNEPVVILCGGRGTRLREHTQTIPKPLVEIGGRPILWHVIRIYAHQGFRRFILCVGHKGELIEEFVRGNGLPEGVAIECVQTGEDTPTGGRIARVRDRLEGERFCATYADGVADIDLTALLDFHVSHGPATMVWGTDDVDGALRMVLRPGRALLEFRSPSGRLDRSRQTCAP